jgi:hypothetical protein
LDQELKVGLNGTEIDVLGLLSRHGEGGDRVAYRFPAVSRRRSMAT